MAYRVKAYTLREESTESSTRYFISFKDGQGKSHELEVSEQFFMEFRQMERRNRNLFYWDERHRELNEVWDDTLYRRALRGPKSLDERMVEEERNETLYKAVGFGRNPRKVAQGILSVLRTGRANPTSWKCRNSSLWSFGRWSAGTGIFSTGTSGTGS